MSNRALDPSSQKSPGWLRLLGTAYLGANGPILVPGLFRVWQQSYPAWMRLTNFVVMIAILAVVGMVFAASVKPDRHRHWFLVGGVVSLVWGGLLGFATGSAQIVFASAQPAFGLALMVVWLVIRREQPLDAA